MKQIVIFLVENPADQFFTKSVLDEANVPSSLSTFIDVHSLIKESDLLTVIPDIILLDLSAGLTNELKSLNNLRNHLKFKNVPIIIFSNSTYLEDYNATFELGANMYIPKQVFQKDPFKAIQFIFDLVEKEILGKSERSAFVLSDVDKVIKLSRY